MSYFDQTSIANAAGNPINPAQDETIILLRRIAKLLESNNVTDSSQRQRIIAEQATAANLNATVTFSAAQSVNATAVASTVNMGQVVVGYGGQATAAANIIDSRFSMIDTARAAYANGIRSKLV